jgi:peptide/nickel transport system substrate-binding protein
MNHGPDTLVIAMEKVDFLPPDRVTDDTSILTLKSLVLEPLCGWRDGVATPALFSHWEHDETGRDWTFHLRPGATFHDGQPCRVEDILDFIAKIQTSLDTFGMKWSYARYFEGVAFTAASPTVLRAQCPQPFGDLPDVFTDFFIARLDQEGRAILGTGPYRVTDFEPRVSAHLERIGAGGPKSIIALAEPDADARLRMVRSGQADVATHVERVEHALDFGPDLSWGKAVSTLSVMAYLDCSQGLFRHAAARRAINHAVDQARIVDGVFGGLARAAATVVSPYHLGFPEAGVTPIAYDPDAAKRLLDGLSGEDEIVLRSPLVMPEKAPEFSAAIRDDLERIGLRVRLDLQPDRPEYAREIGRKQMGEVAVFDSSPHTTFRVLNDKISSAVKGIWWQGHDDPVLEPMIARANHALALPERQAAYGRCLARLNHNPPWLYLVHPIEVFAARTGVQGLTLDHKGVLRLAPSP